MTISSSSSLAQVAVVVASALKDAGIDAVLTGGACATFYSGGAYLSHDLDFIVRSGGTRRALDDTLERVGFRREGDRYLHPSTTFFVEFPRGPLAIGDDLEITPVLLHIEGGMITALSATDACRDRLAAFFHWSDRQSLAVAVAIAREHSVAISTIQAWSHKEGFVAQFDEFAHAVQRP